MRCSPRTCPSIRRRRVWSCSLLCVYPTIRPPTDAPRPPWHYTPLRYGAGAGRGTRSREGAGVPFRPAGGPVPAHQGSRDAAHDALRSAHADAGERGVVSERVAPQVREHVVAERRGAGVAAVAVVVVVGGCDGLGRGCGRGVG